MLAEEVREGLPEKGHLSKDLKLARKKETWQLKFPAGC